MVMGTPVPQGVVVMCAAVVVIDPVVVIGAGRSEAWPVLWTLAVGSNELLLWSWVTRL